MGRPAGNVRKYARFRSGRTARQQDRIGDPGQTPAFGYRGRGIGTEVATAEQDRSAGTAEGKSGAMANAGSGRPAAKPVGAAQRPGPGQSGADFSGAVVKQVLSVKAISCLFPSLREREMGTNTESSLHSLPFYFYQPGFYLAYVIGLSIL